MRSLYLVGDLPGKTDGLLLAGFDGRAHGMTSLTLAVEAASRPVGGQCLFAITRLRVFQVTHFQQGTPGVSNGKKTRLALVCNDYP
jgi:hypothetical protein